MKISIYGAGAIGGFMAVGLVDVETPTIDIVLALAQQMGRVAGVYPVYPEPEPDGAGPAFLD